MSLSLIKYGNITLTTIIILPVQSPLYLVFLVRLGGYIVNSLDCYSYRFIGKLTVFFFSFRNSSSSTKLWTIPLRHVTFSVTLKDKVGNTLPKTPTLRINLNVDGTRITSKTHTHPSHSQTSRQTSVLRIVLNIDDTPISSKPHTHPSHSETSRLLTSSLSLGVPVPRATQCIRVV
jgi:hypothetical protein